MAYEPMPDGPFDTTEKEVYILWIFGTMAETLRNGVAAASPIFIRRRQRFRFRLRRRDLITL